MEDAAPPPPYAGPSLRPYPLPAQRPPSRYSPWFYIAIIGGCFAVMGAILWATVHLGKGFGASSIAVIDIKGVILSPDKIESQLRTYGDDPSIKAIILRINSPGGAAAPSQELYHDVLRLRQEKHKKVVASIDSVGASGAYYIASACDRIYANQASVVGSIGVVMEWTNYGDLFRWAKLKNIAIHAGELKTAGDPTRDMTPQEQAYFQSLVDNMYTQFVHDVATGRHATDDTIKPLATGQVWTGQQALPLGLIDQQGGFRIALADTAKAVGISGEPNLVRPSDHPSSLLDILTSSGEDLFPNPGKLLDQAPGFYFLWK